MTTTAAVQYVIRRNEVLSLRDIARNLHLNQAEVIESLETDPAIVVEWFGRDGNGRVTGSSNPMLSWVEHSNLQDMPTYQWAAENGLLDRLSSQPQTPSSEESTIGDFDELDSRSSLENLPFQQQITASAEQIAEFVQTTIAGAAQRLVELVIPTGDPGSDGEPPMQPEPSNVEPNYTQQPQLFTLREIQTAAVSLLQSMLMNSRAIPTDAVWSRDLDDLFVWLSRTTFGNSVWRLARFSQQNLWVPIAVHPDLQGTFSPSDLVDLLTKSKHLLGADRWREERAALGLTENPQELWAQATDEVAVQPAPEAEEEVAERVRGIGHGVWLDTTVLDPDDLISLKQVIGAAKEAGFSQYLVLKAIGGDHCPNPPHSTLWTVYYDSHRRRWLQEEVLQHLEQDLAFLRSIARQREAAAS